MSDRFLVCDVKPPEGYPQARGALICISGTLCRDPLHYGPKGGYRAKGDTSERPGWPGGIPGPSPKPEYPGMRVETE